MEREIRDLIHDVDSTFRRDDVTSAPRKVLEDLIVRLYDGLTDLSMMVVE